MKTTYGYAPAPNGLLQIIPEQAAVVQEIYRQYLSGKSLGGIADFLFKKGIPSPAGKERWSRSVLDAMLSNSKYLGGIIGFDDYYAVQAEKGSRSNIDEDNNKRKATQYYSKDVLSGLRFDHQFPKGTDNGNHTFAFGNIDTDCVHRHSPDNRFCNWRAALSSLPILSV